MSDPLTGPVEEVVCRDLVELATDYVEGTLAPEQLDLVEEHLMMCDWCRDYLGQIERIRELATDLRDEPPADEVLAAFRAARERGES